MPAEKDNFREHPEENNPESGTPEGAGFTGGTQEKTREADQSIQERSDSGNGI